MLRTVTAAILLMCIAAPVWGSEPESFDSDQPFEQALATNFIRSLLNQVLDRLENHLEISGNRNPNQTKGDRRSHLRFKFYPEGRSKSDQHLRAGSSSPRKPDNMIGISSSSCLKIARNTCSCGSKHRCSSTEAIHVPGSASFA